MSTAKRPPQHESLNILTPRSEQPVKISLMKRLNKIGDKGQLWRTPFRIWKDSEYLLSTLTHVLEVTYKFLINSKLLPLIPKRYILLRISPIGTES